MNTEIHKLIPSRKITFNTIPGTSKRVRMMVDSWNRQVAACGAHIPATLKDARLALRGAKSLLKERNTPTRKVITELVASNILRHRILTREMQEIERQRIMGLKPLGQISASGFRLESPNYQEKRPEQQLYPGVIATITQR